MKQAERGFSEVAGDHVWGLEEAIALISKTMGEPALAAELSYADMERLSLARIAAAIVVQKLQANTGVKQYDPWWMQKMREVGGLEVSPGLFRYDSGRWIDA